MSITKVPYRMGKKLGVSNDGELQDVFQSSQKSHAYFFSDSVDINMFAKYKPFVPPTGTSGIYNDHFTAADGTPNTTGDRYAAALSKYFGLTPPERRATADAVGSNGDHWVYTRPVQGQNPLRALDFEGYDHLAPPPCRKLGDPSTGEIKVAIAGTTTFSFGAYIEHPISGGDWVTWGDLPELVTGDGIGSYHLCVVFFTGQNFTGNMLAKTSATLNTLSSSGIVLDITNSELRTLLGGNYKYYLLCARKDAISNGTELKTPGSNTYVALPTKNGISDVSGKFTISLSNVGNLVISSVSSAQSPTATNNFTLATNYRSVSYSDTDTYYFKATNYIQFGVTVTANSNAAVTLNNIKISLSHTYFSDTPIAVQDVTMYTASGTSLVQASSVNIPANTSKVVYFVCASKLMLLDADGREWNSPSNQYFTTSVSFYQDNALLASDQIRVRNYDNIP